MLVFNWLLGRDQVKHEIWPHRLAFFPSANFTLPPKHRPPKGPFKCMGFWYIRSRISATEKTHSRPFAFISVTEVYAVFKTSSANGPHLNVWSLYVSAAEFPQQKKTRVFGLNIPLRCVPTRRDANSSNDKNKTTTIIMYESFHPASIKRQT